MRIPAPPPGFAAHGGALSCVSHDDEAANSIGGPATAAQAMAVLHDAMQGMPCDHDAMAKSAALGVRVALAFEAAHAGMDIQLVRINPSSLADSRAQLFGGERPCP